MKQIALVDTKPQYEFIKRELNSVYTRVMRSGVYILGEEVEAFEHEFASSFGARYAVGVASGFDALTISLRALGIGPGDEVITVPHTFVATIDAIRAVGATPVFVDITPNTLLMDVSLVESRITRKTKAILPVHLYGSVADMDALTVIAKKHTLFIVEDACQAHGSVYKGRAAGTLGDIGCFSFYPSKNMGAYGDGGILLTRSREIAKAAAVLRNVGQLKKNIHTLHGYNSRLDSLQAAFLRVKLGHLRVWNQKRRALARLYVKLLAGLPVTPVYVPDYVVSNYHLFVIQSTKRDALGAHLASRGIATGIHYPIPVHLQKSMQSYGYVRGDFPVAEAAARRVLSLPMYPELTVGEVRRVADAIRTFFRRV